MSASSVAVKTFVMDPISNSVRSSGGPAPGRTSPRKRTSVCSPSRTAQTSAWWRRPACAARTSSIGATSASYGRARRKPPEWGQESASRSGTFGRVPDTSSIVRRALGGEIDRALRPVLLVTLLHAISGSARVSFLGIWAIRELDASSLALGVTFTCAAIAAVFTGYLGGHASDHIGRRPLILAASGGQAAVAILLVANGDALLTGLVLVVVGGAV